MGFQCCCTQECININEFRDRGNFADVMENPFVMSLMNGGH